MEKKRPFFLGCPMHDSRLYAGTARSFYQSPSAERLCLNAANSISLINANCNALWATALNLYEEHNIEWFVLLHSDIEPDEDHWVDKLLVEATRVKAEMISVCVPIKDSQGLTSTCYTDMDNPWVPLARITLRQLWHEKFPATFSPWGGRKALASLPEDLRVEIPGEAQLLLNTGCMGVNMDWGYPLAEKLFFETKDRIAKFDGKWKAQVQPEDWLFTQKVQQNGGRIFGTRIISLSHKGAASYPNTHGWGNKTDTECVKI